MPYIAGYETVAAIRTTLVRDFDGTVLTASDLNQADFRKYLESYFHRDVVGRMFKETFKVPGNTTILKAFDATAIYIDTVINTITLPVAGNGYASPTANVMHTYTNAVKHARGKHKSVVDAGI